MTGRAKGDKMSISAICQEERRKRMNSLNFEIGDVVGFSGRSLVSDFINVSTFGIPRWGISHVGIVCEEPRNFSLQLAESADGFGVRRVPLHSAIKDYDGRVWRYGVKKMLRLYQRRSLAVCIRKLLDRPYDARGAVQSGGRLWSWIQSVCRGEDLTNLFCSEFVAEVLSEAEIFKTENSSRWNPNHLVRELQRRGIVNEPKRLK